MHMMIEVHLDTDPRQWGTGIPHDTVTAACRHLAGMIDDHVAENWPEADSYAGGVRSLADSIRSTDPDFGSPPPHADIYVTVDDDDDGDADTIDEADVEASIEDFIADNWEAALDAVMHQHSQQEE
jgi:hypothetical protein